MRKFFSVVSAIALLAIIFGLTYGSVVFFVSATQEIQAALIGLFGVAIAAMVSHYFSQKRDIQSRQFSQKVKAYEGVFDLMFELMKAEKLENPLSENEMYDHAVKIKRDLLIWAGADVLKVWIEFEKEADKGEGARVFVFMERILKALRKELGHSDQKLNDGELVKWFVKASDHSEVDEWMKK